MKKCIVIKLFVRSLSVSVTAHDVLILSFVARSRDYSPLELSMLRISGKVESLGRLAKSVLHLSTVE